MRKFFISAALAMLSAAAGAQTFSEALLYSQNNYYGTARSMALSNAMTALGGDLGSVGINPAGSAVASYSQFTISPGLTVSSTTSTYSSWVDDVFGPNYTMDRKKSNLPNVGCIMNYDTYNDYGIKSYSFGFVSNSTATYTGGFEAGGANDMTSILGSFAAAAGYYTPGMLNNTANYYGTGIPWNQLVAYQSGMISQIYGTDGNPLVDNAGYYTYAGATEGVYPLEDGSYDIYTMGTLNQKARVATAGIKHDMVFNFGMNINDNLYVGFNLGMPVADYRYDESFTEYAVNPSDFALEYSDGKIAEFSNASYRYTQASSIAGIYAKIGVIWAPEGGFRLGAALQTPTSFTVQDRWQVEGSTSFTNSMFDAAASSPVNEYSYTLIAPARFNIGAAYTFFGAGLISLDFEMADYSTMRFRTYDIDSDYSYSMENAVNKFFGCPSFSGRLGLEYRVLPALSLRAGASYQTSPECGRYDLNGNELSAGSFAADYYLINCPDPTAFLADRKIINDMVTSFSAGAGYSSAGSFFADFAVRRTMYPKMAYNPYSDYISANGDYLPQVDVKRRSVLDMVLTLGWRF